MNKNRLSKNVTAGTANPIAVSNDMKTTVPERWRALICFAALSHLFIVSICLSTSDRMSNLGLELLGFISPYAVTTNLRMNLQSIAVTEPSLIESPIAVRFRATPDRSSDAESGWIDWAQSGRTTDKSSISAIRRQRYLRQLVALMSVQSDDGVAQMIDAMMHDVQSSDRQRLRAGPDSKMVFDEFQIIQLPLVPSNQWFAAERFRAEAAANRTDLPDGLQPEILLAAKIVRLADGTVGLLPEIETLRTVPVVNEPE